MHIKIHDSESSPNIHSLCIPNCQQVQLEHLQSIFHELNRIARFFSPCNRLISTSPHLRRPILQNSFELQRIIKIFKLQKFRSSYIASNNFILLRAFYIFTLFKVRCSYYLSHLCNSYQVAS